MGRQFQRGCTIRRRVPHKALHVNSGGALARQVGLGLPVPPTGRSGASPPRRAPTKTPGTTSRTPSASSPSHRACPAGFRTSSPGPTRGGTPGRPSRTWRTGPSTTGSGRETFDHDRAARWSLHHGSQSRRKRRRLGCSSERRCISRGRWLWWWGVSGRLAADITLACIERSLADAVSPLRDPLVCFCIGIFARSHELRRA